MEIMQTNKYPKKKPIHIKNGTLPQQKWKP